MAAPTLPIPAGGAVLVTAFFTPRLRRGVHAVVAVPAARGSGCRGAMRRAVAAAAAPGDAGDDKLQDDDAYYGDLETYGVEALQMLSCIKPPAHLKCKFDAIKDALEKAVKKAKGKEKDKTECAKALLYGIYGVADLGEECAPKETPGILSLNPWLANNEEFSMMLAVKSAMGMASDSLCRCIGHTAAGFNKLLQLEDPEDW